MFQKPLSSELSERRSSFPAAGAPETPYTAARREWTDRYGGLVRSVYSWRIQALGGYVVIVALAGALAYKSLQSTVQPIHIRIEANGQPTVLGTIPAKYTPQFAEIRYALNEWLTWTRAIPLDPVLVKANYTKALGRMRQGAGLKLNEWAQKEPRFQAVGRETVAVQTAGIVQIGTTNSYQARWTEEFRGQDGALKDRQTWTATFTVEQQMPTTVAELNGNPIGLWIKDFQWARE